VTTLAVTDTHALIWALTGHRNHLGRRARRVFDAAEAGHAAIYVPVIVLVELGEAVRKGTVSLEGGFERWARALFASGRYHPADLTVPIVVRAQSLVAIPERSDRLIAATAVELECPLITRDEEIAGVLGVEVIW
jgi:PIN domain nuclease of toxin-antitoxin system